MDEICQEAEQAKWPIDRKHVLSIDVTGAINGSFTAPKKPCYVLSLLSTDYPGASAPWRDIKVPDRCLSTIKNSHIPPPMAHLLCPPFPSIPSVNANQIHMFTCLSHNICILYYI
jgi:hypothetical protein